MHKSAWMARFIFLLLDRNVRYLQAPHYRRNLSVLCTLPQYLNLESVVIV